MRNFLKWFAACAAIVFGLAACSGNGTSVNSLKLNRNIMTIAVGGEGLLVAEDVLAQNVIWTSNNSNIASVDNGKIYGVAEGRAIITVTSQNGKITDKCDVYVEPVENTYTVRYDKGKIDGVEIKGSMPDQTFAYGRNENLLKNEFEADGYDFIGWAKKYYNEDNYGARQYDDCESVSPLTTNENKSVVILYAKWKPKKWYAIKYHNIYDGYIKSEVDKFEFGDVTFTLPNNNAEGDNVVVRPGYTFTGWGMDEISFNQKNDIDVYANWERKTGIDGELYDDFRYISLTRNRIVLAVGEEIVLVPTGIQESLKNKVLVWTSDDVGIAKVDENGKLMAISAGDTTITVTTIDGAIVANCDVVVFSRNETFEVRYDKHDGIGEMNDQTIHIEDNLLPNEFSRAGYQFIGWAKGPDYPNRYSDREWFKRYIYRDNNFNGAFEYSDSRKDRRRITLYARWRKLDSEYAIFYRDLFDGFLPKGTPDTFTKDTETFALAEPTRPGYTFAGWDTGYYTWDGFESGYVEGEKITEIPKGTERDYFLYAKWIPNNIAVSVDIKQYRDEAGEISYTRRGNEVTFTAPPGRASYAWWRNGLKLEGSGNSISFDTSSLSAGAYTITVVMDGAYSASCAFDLRK